MAPTTFIDLPPELLDNVVEFVETAHSVSSLGATSKTLHAFVENNAWKKFVSARFPSLSTGDAASYRDTARTLTTLSKAWDRRAIVARYSEPRGKIRSLPQNQVVERWQRPRGQTLGFTPQLDCFDEGHSSFLAFTAGAQICIRQRKSRPASKKDDEWMLYRPSEAVEGRDDVTSLHLLRPQYGPSHVDATMQAVTGTANGDLWLLEFSSRGTEDIVKSHFVTGGLPVRSSSVLQQSDSSSLLAATIGDSQISLYEIDSNRSTVPPSSTIELITRANGRRKYRAWSTRFLSPGVLAVGLGPCPEPLQLHSVTPTGISKEPLRKFGLQNESENREDTIASAEHVKRPSSSIYPIVPLAPATHGMGGSETGQLFLSGAYDGIIRLHDLRSQRDVEQMYIDPTDESAIYSLLPRGRESVAAGSSRHSVVKMFDLRMGAKAYSYIDAVKNNESSEDSERGDWNLFLKPHSATYPGRGGGNNWARRSAESSVYSLTSPSACSPFVYAGLENAVMELAFTSVLDPHPDVPFLASTDHGRRKASVQGFENAEVVDLAMYDQTGETVKLKTQRRLSETSRPQLSSARNEVLPGLDERWRVAW